MRWSEKNSAATYGFGIDDKENFLIYPDGIFESLLPLEGASGSTKRSAQVISSRKTKSLRGDQLDRPIRQQQATMCGSSPVPQGTSAN
jgi:hypothetical protein